MTFCPCQAAVTAAASPAAPEPMTSTSQSLGNDSAGIAVSPEFLLELNSTIFISSGRYCKARWQLLVDYRTLECLKLAVAIDGMESSSRIRQIFRDIRHGW
jgi:hypothetical protein